MHNSRCENSKMPPEKCRCSCKGALHGIGNHKKEEDLGILMTEDMGGEVAEFIRKYKGAEYYCFGTHKSEHDAIHVAENFYGYEHDGGLADKNGKRWWVFVRCTKPRVKGLEYETSFMHFYGAVEKAKIEREAQAYTESGQTE